MNMYMNPTFNKMIYLLKINMHIHVHVLIEFFFHFSGNYHAMYPFLYFHDIGTKCTLKFTSKKSRFKFKCTCFCA